MAGLGADVFVRKINVGLDVRQQLDDGDAQEIDALPEAAFELFARRARSVCARIRSMTASAWVRSIFP